MKDISLRKFIKRQPRKSQYLWKPVYVSMPLQFQLQLRNQLEQKINVLLSIMIKKSIDAFAFSRFTNISFSLQHTNRNCHL